MEQVDHKRYIMEYGHYMNKDTKIRILNLVMYYIEDNDLNSSDFIIKSGSGLNFVLDKLPDSINNGIYDIIYKRMEILNSPYIEKQTPKLNFNFGDG